MKYILSFLIVIIIYVIVSNIVVANNLIPDDAIRVRVIANSNDDYDQQIKYEVKDIVEDDMYNILSGVKDLNEARNKINSNLSNVENDIDSYLKNNNYNLDFNINFGYNYFTKKEFKGITYKEGYYESVVVTLGEGKGDNWWCVLFPPLCLIEAEESSDVEYTSLVKEIIDKYF